MTLTPQLPALHDDAQVVQSQKALSQCDKSDTVPPVTILDQAYAEARELVFHDKLRYGDIIRIAQRHGLDCKGYDTLKQRIKRYRHGIVTQKCVGTHRRIKPAGGKPENFDAHGQLYYQTLVLSEPHLAKIPRQIMSRWGKPWYRELSHPDFTLRAFASGRCLVFAHQITWRDSIQSELSKLWEPQAVSSFISCLQVNGCRLELAIAIPGVPSGQHYEDKAGLVSIDTDHTPKSQGNVEIKVNIGEFDRRFSAMEQQIANLVTSGGYLGLQQLKDQVFILAKDMRSMVALFSSYLKAGSPAIVEGSTAEVPLPVSGSNPELELPYGVQAVLKPGVIARHCPHLATDEGAMALKCSKTYPRMRVASVEGQTIVPLPEFFRGERFVCKSDFRSCNYFQSLG